MCRKLFPLAALATVSIAAHVGLHALGQIFHNATAVTVSPLVSEVANDDDRAASGAVIQTAYRETLGPSR